MSNRIGLKSEKSYPWQESAGIKGKSGPPGNQNAFRHGLASISDRRATGALTPEEQSIRQEILSGLIADRGVEQQISTATRILAEVIAADAALLVAFNKATDAVIEKNQKARENRKLWRRWTATSAGWSPA